ncbi:Strawberry notch-like protein [Zostera marina]|uniref:Strawberry notch-like protein n=1 Tax=Zostera marina TaxID=29655 RepID=A0A0K9PCI8_ZOSMR|nr:Strawberry notch-like protein [Zostera marina]
MAQNTTTTATSSSITPSSQSLLPPPSGCQVRCAGCHWILTVASGMTEFSCPKCQLPQMLPPELMIPGRRPPPPAQGIDPTKIQLPCARCKAILNVPHGLTRFACPQCGVDLAVDMSKLHNYMSVAGSALGTGQGFVNPGNLSEPEPEAIEEIDEVAVDIEREEDGGGLAGDTFMEYSPPKSALGLPHPDPVVETSSLSAIQLGEPKYDPKIKDNLNISTALSCLQMETIIYACQRHLNHLSNGTRAGYFIGDGAGVGKGRTVAGMIWENWHCGRHKALWISAGSDLKFDARRDLDDIGATCIEVHALNKLPYSKLDSKAVGIKDGVIFSTYSSLIASSEKGRSRLQQLLQWCGSDYDGLIVFDECHKAKNLIAEAGTQRTRTGEAVVDIQVQLPEARVVYCSATGASEPRNMGYMVRLGLWGEGTSFIYFSDFLSALDKGGVGALELVAMDMKARGMYVCRTLSYKGSEFEVVEVALEDKMLMYEAAARFWAELRVELLAATSVFTETKPNNFNQLWRSYWSYHQRFFRYMCMSAKVPAAIKLSNEALQENKCVVIGLQSTGEARTEEVVTKYGLELDDFVSGPRELLLKLVEENYPLPLNPEPVSSEDSVKELKRKRHSATPLLSYDEREQKVKDGISESASDDGSAQEIPSESNHESESESDDEFQICEVCNGEMERKKLLCCSCCHKVVHPSCLVPPYSTDILPSDWSCNPCLEQTEEYLQKKRAYIAEISKRYEAAKERKSKFLEMIRQMELPNNALDDIIDQLGGPDRVAEITGRRSMLVRVPGGKGVIYQARNTKDISMEMMNMHEKKMFMDGKKLVAIISEAGSAGVSLQADRRAINQKRRVHITLELPWSADRAIQQFGRTHRSNQASAPQYRFLITNLGGERRFASIVAKRLESLGALTQGDRRAGPSLNAYNYDNSSGKKALMMMYKGIMEQDSLPVIPLGCSSENPSTIEEFLNKAKAALISVGIIRDAVLGNGKSAGKLSGRIVDSDMHDVIRFLNRLLGLPPEIQNKLFNLFTSILDILVQNARNEGQLDTGIVDIRGSTIEMQGSPKTVHVDNLSGASTVLFTFTIDRGMTWESAKSFLDEKEMTNIKSSNDGFYESRRERMGRRHFLLAIESSSIGSFKIMRPAVGEALREMSSVELKNKYRKTFSIDEACQGWKAEYDMSRNLCMHGPNCKVGIYCTVGRRLQELNVLGGLVLPVWRTIEKALSKQVIQSHKRIRIVRLETTKERQRIVGLLVPNAAVDDVLQDLSWVQDIDE